MPLGSDEGMTPEQRRILALEIAKEMERGSAAGLRLRVVSDGPRSPEPPPPGDFDAPARREPGDDSDPVGPVPSASVPDRTASELIARWRTLGTWGDWLNSEPPKRRYLLSSPEGGVLPLGKVAMLAAAGGAGKSWLTVQLALCVATGRKWMGCDVAAPGRVLLALGEEDAEEAQRRLYWGCQELGLDDKERRLAAERIVVLPLAGTMTSLMLPADADQLHSDTSKRDPADGLPVTLLYWRFLELLEQNSGDDGWRLLIVDPLSRFAGPDTEVDNHAATLFVEALERLAHVHGDPAVFLTHHTNKTSRKEGALDGTDASGGASARGASGLHDGVRWQAILEPLKRVDGAPEISVLRVVKNNYGVKPADTYLARNPDRQGAPHVATTEEYAAYQNGAQDAKTARRGVSEAHQEEQRKRERDSLVEAVCKEVYRAGKPISSMLIAQNLGKRRQAVEGALQFAANGGMVRRAFQGKKPVGWELVPEPSEADDSPRQSSFSTPETDPVRIRSGSGPGLDRGSGPDVVRSAPYVVGADGTGSDPLCDRDQTSADGTGSDRTGSPASETDDPPDPDDFNVP